MDLISSFYIQKIPMYFFEDAVFHLLHVFSIFVKYQMAVIACKHVLVFYFLQLIYIPVFLLVLCSAYYFSYLLYLEIWNVIPSSIVTFAQIALNKHVLVCCWALTPPWESEWEGMKSTAETPGIRQKANSRLFYSAMGRALHILLPAPRLCLNPVTLQVTLLCLGMIRTADSACC